jgi:hypothetical protein
MEKQMAENRLDKRVEELRIEIDLESQVERVAQERLDGLDEGWNNDRERSINKMFDLVVSFKEEDPPSKAVHLLGQLLAEVEKIRAPREIVRRLDSKRKLLHNLQDQRRVYEESKAKARESFEAQRLAMGS